MCMVTVLLYVCLPTQYSLCYAYEKSALDLCLLETCNACSLHVYRKCTFLEWQAAITPVMQMTAWHLMATSDCTPMQFVRV